MKLYIRLLCTGMLLVPAYHEIAAKQEDDSDYMTSSNIKDYRPKNDSSFELSENQKLGLKVGGALLGAAAAGAAAYGAYQYANTPDDSITITTTDALRGELSNPQTMKELTGQLNSPEYVNNPEYQKNFLNQRFPGLTESEKQGILAIATEERINPSVLRPSQQQALYPNEPVTPQAGRRYGGPAPLPPAQPLSERPMKPLPISEYE